MIDGGRVLALIPARGGSRGLPRKNVRDLGGRPLLAWSIAAAQGCSYVDRIVVSTEDEEISAIARKFGGEVPFVRPADLSADDTPGMAPVLHALKAVPGFDWLVVLQPTSPLRIAADINACLERCAGSAAPACVSVCEAAEYPHLMFTLDSNRKVAPLLGWDHVNSRRQELPQAYVLNGAVYAARTDWLERHGSFISPETLGHVMPRERSVDIDTQEDLELAESMLERARP